MKFQTQPLDDSERSFDPLRTACSPICTTVESKWPLGFLPIVGSEHLESWTKECVSIRKRLKRKQILVYFALGIACAI